MADDFSDLRDDDFEESPDWIDDSAGEEVDAFDQLRRKSARAGSMYEEMAVDEEESGDSPSSFSFGNFTPAQRLILALLVLLDIVAIGFGLLVVAGRFG